MSPARLMRWIAGRCVWTMVTELGRRDLRMNNSVPIVSFTFDDFPRCALQVGGEILRSQGFAGTYYASLGLVDKDSPVGRIFSAADLETLLMLGHELGCHTFSHCDAWKTEPEAFEASIIENRRALGRLLPQASFKTFSYPIDIPRVRTKKLAGRHFACCRGGGGQTFNSGTIDLNNLHAYFLEMSRDRPESIREIINRNCSARGWLIFATHDIAERPSQFGCTPALFKKVVRWAADSGARILPVARALEEMTSQRSGRSANDPLTVTSPHPH